MTWTFTDDPERYADHVLALLTSRIVENTLPLTVLDSVRAGQPFGPAPMLFGWYQQHGAVTGAVSMTPPYGLLLAELPEASELELVSRLRADQIQVPDVAGEIGAVERFVAQWTAGNAVAAEVLMRQRLYRLDQLRPPVEPAGSARLVTVEDLDLVMDWLAAFRREADQRMGRLERSAYQRRIDLGLLWFWLDEAGDPVALAGRNVMIAGMSRIGPVYTPPEFRRRGYGEAARLPAPGTRSIRAPGPCCCSPT